ncbi:hypothetical protein ACJX0J_008778, partial [Zea mays]
HIVFSQDGIWVLIGTKEVQYTLHYMNMPIFSCINHFMHFHFVVPITLATVENIHILYALFWLTLNIEEIIACTCISESDADRVIVLDFSTPYKSFNRDAEAEQEIISSWMLGLSQLEPLSFTLVSFLFSFVEIGVYKMQSYYTLRLIKKPHGLIDDPNKFDP